MKLLKTSFRLMGVALCVGVGMSMANGCAAGTEAKRAEARGAAGSFRSSLSEMPGRIDQTMSSLMALTDNRSTDKSRTLPEFKKNLSAMDGDAKRLGAEADRASGNADAFFRQWARESVSSSDTQQQDAAEASMMSRRANFQTARSYLDSARKNYIDLTRNLHEIESMYSAGGVDSTQPAVRASIDKAIQDSVNVKNYVARLEEQIDSILGIP